MSYSFFAKYYDLLTENINYNERASYFELLIKKYNSGKKNGTLLDVACGTGNLTEKFCEMGYDTIGADISSEMLNVAYEKKLKKNLPIQYICQDMRSLELYNPVDIAICALDSLNHLDSAKDIEKAFQSISISLNKGGLFIFDMNTPYKHKNILGNETFVYEKEHLFCVWQNEFVGGEDNRTDIFLDFFEEEKDKKYERFGEDFSEIAPDVKKVTDMLENTGFELLGLFDYDSLEEIGESSEKFVCVAKKL